MLTIIRKALHQFWIKDLLLLSGIIALFYFFSLGHYPLFNPDEGRYNEVAREMLVSGDFITPRINGIPFLDKPIFYYWLQASAIHLFGLKEWALRLFPALFGVLGCLVTYCCGRQLFNRKTGIIAALMLALSPLYFIGAHYANLDLEVAVLISISLLLFITGISKTTTHQKTLILGSYVSAALAFLTKGMIAVAFPVIIITLWMITSRSLSLIKNSYLLSGIFVFLCITAPWFLLVQNANPDFFHYFFVTQQVNRFLSAATFNNPSPFWFYGPIVFVGFFPWIICFISAIMETLSKEFLSKDNEVQQQQKINLYLLIWIGVIFIFFSIPHAKITTYILPIFPALALFTAQYITASWERVTSKQMRWLSISFTISGFLLSLALIWHKHYLPVPFNAYLYVLIIVTLMASILAIFLYKQKTLFLFWLLNATYSVFVLLTIVLGASYLNTQSTKPLITELKKIIEPQDEVAVYYKYYQDIPLYLERRVIIVANWQDSRINEKDNWLRELWLRKKTPDSANWLIDENDFWSRWHSDKRIFVFLTTNALQQFKKQASTYFFIGKNHSTVLLSNQPTFLSAEMKAKFLEMRRLSEKAINSKLNPRTPL